MNYRILKSTTVYALLLCLPFTVLAQKTNWQNLDLKTDTVFGISTERAYSELLTSKKASAVVVAVLDGGVDINHEDLKDEIWTNPKEISGNAKDDDHNGYTDDLHGWSFLGSAKGSINYETLELTRLVRRDAARFETAANIAPKDSGAYRDYLANKKFLNMKLTEAQHNLTGASRFKAVLDTMVKRIGKAQPARADFDQYKPTNGAEERVKKTVMDALAATDYNNFYEHDLGSTLNHLHIEADYNLNVNYDPRPIVGDNPENDSERYYGCNDVSGPDATHGTHVAGIIAANRVNTLGIKGIAGDVKIMVVRCTPNGDERDKDVANSIRYAADNGAKVINMSFGKDKSWDKQVVDEAVQYAMKKDVLIIQAAGNDNKDLDREVSFPSPYYLSGGRAQAYITVGASGWINDGTLKANFSNYGKTKVDVFAPGVQIRSTIPGSKYDTFDGTSMAAPVVTGLAALIRSYYPGLSALQVKEIILASVVKADQLKDYCSTGGVVNAFNALQMAAAYQAKTHTAIPTDLKEKI